VTRERITATGAKRFIGDLLCSPEVEIKVRRPTSQPATGTAAPRGRPRGRPRGATNPAHP